MKVLTNFLEQVKYGWIDLEGNVHEKIDKDKFMNDYRLLNPDKLEKQMIGICFDMVEYERKYLNDRNIDCKSLLIVHEKDYKPMIHAFLIYKENNEYFWIEYAFRTMIEIRKYQTLKECLEDVKQEFLLENNISDIGKIYFYSYEKPEYGINQEEFIKHCLKGKLLNQNYSNLEI